VSIKAHAKYKWFTCYKVTRRFLILASCVTVASGSHVEQHLIRWNNVSMRCLKVSHRCIVTTQSTLVTTDDTDVFIGCLRRSSCPVVHVCRVIAPSITWKHLYAQHTYTQEDNTGTLVEKSLGPRRIEPRHTWLHTHGCHNSTHTPGELVDNWHW